MPKWDSLRKTERDEKWYRFWLKHQDWSLLECANHFGTSRTNFNRVILNMKARVERTVGV